MRRTRDRLASNVTRCSHCGSAILKGSAIGFGGKWLCEQCIGDQVVLNKFMENGSRAVRSLMYGLMGGTEV